MNAETPLDSSNAKAAAEPMKPATAPPAPAIAPTVEPAPKRGRRRILMFSVPMLLALVGGYVWLSGGRYEETDNANLHQARLLIASDLSGRVAEVGAVDNQPVAKGALLFRVDPEPYKLALQQADASVAAARVQVAQLKAALSAADAQRNLAQGDLDFVETEAQRQATLTKRGVSSAANQDSAQHDLLRAKQALAAADVGVQGAAAALGGDPQAPVDSHPLVLQAIAARDKAAYTLTQTEVRAPMAGIVYQAASFRPGQFVAAGSPAFSLVATGDSWVDANFKETQLEALRPGEPAEVEFDAFPGRTYHGTVQAVGAGTGAEFSLLPAQNASGNWVKVTQRVPVRLRLTEGQEIGDLRSGLSATVKVDTGRQTGLQRLGDRANAAAAKIGNGKATAGASVTTTTKTTGPSDAAHLPATLPAAAPPPVTTAPAPVTPDGTTGTPATAAP
ncbi:HlyD family secretion protein [Paracoccus suum]|uniref:HlyD family secretion protein n=1 Tax=Paracoccus suum TaxID=2259340 RepID=A0A344PL43_9RHOB|nr:HlyD family secretion protein [Paracoccus suum]AXC50098.1 HlyD family secretion protein [Paracoccus suum]